MSKWLVGSSSTITAAPENRHGAIATRALAARGGADFCCRSAPEDCSIDRNRFTRFFVAVNASESG